MAKKKKVNGKQKGNKFEREIANIFSERFAAYTGIEQSFRRNPDSGSFFGGKNVARAETHDTDWAVYGDLICPKAFRFVVECKNYKKPPTFKSLIDDNISEWDGWLEQVRADARACGKYPLLIIKYNNVPTFVLVDWSVLKGEYVIDYGGARVFPIATLLEQDDPFFFDNTK